MASFSGNLGKPTPERLTNLDFNEARGDRGQRHQLDHMQIIYTSLQAVNHASTSSLNFLQAGCSY